MPIAGLRIADFRNEKRTSSTAGRCDLLLTAGWHCPVSTPLHYPATKHPFAITTSDATDVVQRRMRTEMRIGLANAPFDLATGSTPGTRQLFLYLERTRVRTPRVAIRSSSIVVDETTSTIPLKRMRAANYPQIFLKMNI
ncbi:hypothetical protein V9T40_000203 [Parthenolecanium corni]|uniref:Uncharacterized protein n=1 Tax=Parthenolecanium corni TaxID=536013 RepID=A0AAN9TAR3_9HEMI